MPKQYEDIKAGYEKAGKGEKEAKKLAAMTYIAKGNTGDRSSRAKSLHDAPPKKLRFPSPKRSK